MSLTRSERTAAQRGTLPYNRVRGVLLLQQWRKKRGHDVMWLARKLDRSWGFVKSVLDGRTRPDVGAIFLLRTLARIPVDAWMTGEERTAMRVALRLRVAA